MARNSRTVGSTGSDHRQYDEDGPDNRDEERDEYRDDAGDDEDDGDGEGESGDEGNGAGDARQAAQIAVDYIDEMTGEPPEVVTGVVSEDGGWLVTVEVLELSRVPNTTDVLGCYQVRVDPDGAPVSYQRLRRYHRGQVGEG